MTHISIQHAFDQNCISVFFGPSGVGKTAFLHALAEGHWSIHCELPGVTDRNCKDGRPGLVNALIQSMILRTTIEDVQYDIQRYFLAKMLGLLQLHSAGREDCSRLDAVTA